MKTKFFYFMMAILIVGSLFSCGNDDEPDPETPLKKPRISQITPEEGASGDVVKIIGSNFSDKDNGNLVLFDTKEAKILTFSDKELEVEVPEGLEKGEIKVSVKVGDLTSNIINFIFENKKKFSDDFNRADTDIITNNSNNALGAHWYVVPNTGGFQLSGNKILALMLPDGHYEGMGVYKNSEAIMEVGNGVSYSLSVEVNNIDGKASCGFIFHWKQEESTNEYYILRMGADKQLQCLKMQNGNMTGLPFNDNIPVLTPDKPTLMQITSEKAGEFNVKLSSIETKELLFEAVLNDNDSPLIGGQAGLYSLTGSGQFDNFQLQVFY